MLAALRKIVYDKTVGVANTLPPPYVLSSESTNNLFEPLKCEIQNDAQKGKTQLKKMFIEMQPQNTTNFKISHVRPVHPSPFNTWVRDSDKVMQDIKTGLETTQERFKVLADEVMQSFADCWRQASDVPVKILRCDNPEYNYTSWSLEFDWSGPETSEVLTARNKLERCQKKARDAYFEYCQILTATTEPPSKKQKA